MTARVRKPTAILSTGQEDRMLLFENPTQCVYANTYAQIPEALAVLQEALSQGRFIAGWFGYEVGAFLVNANTLPREAPSTPLLWFGVFPRPVSITRRDLAAEGRAYAGPLTHEWDRATYQQCFNRVQEHIRSGDIYQANLSFRSQFRFVGDALDLYLSLHDTSKVPYSAYIDTGELRVLSLSPERFFTVRGAAIETQPMKGTAARGSTAQGDLQARDALASDPKACAENIMIVDLMRNDLGRLAQPGSVRVTELLGIQTYPTFHTLVSTIRAQLATPVSIGGLLTAILPAGSITGAPKLRAMQILRDIESSPRGIYCGAIGHMTPGGDASFNVAIRTLWLSGDTGMTGVGGGVVADSNASDEYDECLLKASWYAATRRPIGLIETLRWHLRFIRLDKHLDRMAHSALFLSLPFDRSRALKALLSAVSSEDGPLSVRLELSENGDYCVSTRPLPLEKPIWRFVMSPRRVSSCDALAAHKTTWRDLYDDEWNRCCANAHAEEVLFLNERAELTEGTRTNVFLRVGGTMLTPAAASGVLPGILRAEMIGESQCRESRLTLQDLHSADEIFVGNSLRGMIRAAWST